jgi:GNAT superfamily N-acetyltransferase
MSSLGRIEKLRSDHTLEGFDCGKDELNRFLKRHALSNQLTNGAQTYVASRNLKVVGYYSLAVGSVTYDVAPDRIKKGLAHHPVPVMILARLAIDKPSQGQGLGPALLKDALYRTSAASGIAGIRAILVHAKDDTSKSFYEHFDFDPSPTDPFHLFLMVKDLRKLLGP